MSSPGSSASTHDESLCISGPATGTAATDEPERLAREVARLTEELARVQADFQQFAAVISHDLRAPLLSLTGCVELLADQYRGQLGSDADELISHINSSVRRLNDMIKGLLGYSRASSNPLKLTACDLNRVMDGVLERLGPSIHETQAQVARDALPTVQADAERVEQVLEELVKNAIKFRGEARPAIQVRADRENDAWAIRVRDNGEGIAAEHIERAFRVFGRLHGEDPHYAGIGMGLAIARKIAERHGGRLDVRSEPGKGSTFQFWLPAG